MKQCISLLAGMMALLVGDNTALGQKAVSPADIRAVKEHLAATMVVAVDKPSAQSFRSVLEGSLYYVAAGWPNASGHLASWTYGGKFLMAGDTLTELPQNPAYDDTFDLTKHLKADFRQNKPADARSLLDVLLALSADVNLPVGAGVGKKGGDWHLVLTQTDMGDTGFVAKTDAEGVVKEIKARQSPGSLPRLQPASLPGPAGKRFREYLVNIIEPQVESINLGPAAAILNGRVLKLSPGFKAKDGFGAQGQETPVVLQDGKLLQLEGIGSVSNEKDMASFARLVSADFKLKTMDDAKRFEKVLDALYPAGGFGEPAGETAIRQAGKDWHFVRGKFFKNEKGFVVSTQQDGTVSRIVYDLELPTQ